MGPLAVDRNQLRANWSDQFDQHARWLRTVIFARSGGDRDAVDEVLQEVALAAVRRPPRDLAKLAPWLYQTAVRQALQYRRRAGRRKRRERVAAERECVDNNRASPLDWVLADERSQIVKQALQMLRPADREILLLKYTEDWTYRQLADHLGMSESAVESRLHRARAALRRELSRRNVNGAL